MGFESERQQIIDIGRRLPAAGLVTATDGNISLRVGSERFLISASATQVGNLTPDDLVVIDADGNVVEGDRPASSERWMHLTAYQTRADIHAVIHAHPPHCIALSLAGLTFPPDVFPDAVLAFESIPTTDYATPGTKEGAGVIADKIIDRDAVILNKHGALTVGADLNAAWLKMEKLEQLVRMYMMARQLAGEDLPRLTGEQVAKLLDVRRTYGIGK